MNKMLRTISTTLIACLLMSAGCIPGNNPSPTANQPGVSAVDVSLEPQWDPGRVLRNPDKGFYHHYYDNAVNKYLLNNDAFLLNFPGMNHLYVRLAWSYFEPKEGQYDWSYIDELVTKWVPRGYRFSFRITCKETSQTYATPEWVKDLGAKGKMVDNYGTLRWEPDYNDPILLQKLDNFHKAMAARYDGQPWLAYIDVGSLGDWGEGHTNPSSNVVIPVATVKKHIDLYTKYYPKTQLVVTDDLIDWKRTPDEAADLRAYVETRNYTYRDDSILVKYYVTTYPNTGSVSNPELFTAMYPKRPTILETQHYHTIKADGNWQGANGSTRGAAVLKEALRQLRATYIGYHGHADAWLNDNPALARELTNLVGYWFMPLRLKTGEWQAGKPVSVELTMRNAGVAPAYQPYRTYLKLVHTATKAEHLLPLDVDARQWLPGQDVKSVASLTLPASVVPGTYALRLALRREATGQPAQPVELGLKESTRQADEFYQVADAVTVR